MPMKSVTSRIGNMMPTACTGEITSDMIGTDMVAAPATKPLFEKPVSSRAGMAAT